jgi:glycosyltransferase involved in cell wall biosynthesis
MLRRLLDALAAQTLRDHEVIVVDDGSTDGTGDEVVAAGRAARLLQGSGSGAVAARCQGVAGSRGAFLAFTDDDCVPRPDWLAAGVAALEGGADVVQGVTRPLGSVRPLDRTIVVERHDGLYNTCNVFYRASAYRAAGGFDVDAGRRLGFRPGRFGKNLGFGEDALLGWRVRRHGRAAFAPDAVVEHAVFPPDLADSLRRAWMTGAFPALVREIPELRETALAWRFFLGTTRLPLYGAAVSLAVGRPGPASLGAGCWVARRSRVMGRGLSRRRYAVGLFGELALDATVAVALAAGSVRARRIVL